jgi:malic enzyme
MLTCLGAGAAGIATLDLLCELGFQKSNILSIYLCKKTTSSLLNNSSFILLVINAQTKSCEK